MPGPQGCVGGCLRVVARGMAVGARLRGASGTPPPTVCPGMGGSGSLPLIRPCGATFPQGGRQGLLLAAAQGFAGRRGRRALRFAREWAAAGACPSSGPAGPPSPKGEGKGCCWRRRKVSRGVEDAAPCGLPGNGRQREPAPHPALRGHLPPRGKARVVVGGGARFRGVSGTPPLRMGIWKRCGVYADTRSRAAAR